MRTIIKIISVFIFSYFIINSAYTQISFKKTLGTDYDDFPTNILINENRNKIFGIKSYPYFQGETFTTLYRMTDDGDILHQNEITKADTNLRIDYISKSYLQNEYFGAGQLKTSDSFWLWLLTFDEEFNINWQKKVELPNFISIGRTYIVKKDYSYYLALSLNNTNEIPVNVMCRYSPAEDTIVFSEWSMEGGSLGDLEANMNNDNFLYGGTMLERNFSRLWEVTPDLELSNEYDSLENDIYHMIDLEWRNDNELLYAGTYQDEDCSCRKMGIQIMDTTMNVQQFNSFGNTNVERNYVGALNSIAIDNNENIYLSGTEQVLLNQFPNIENYLAIHKLDTNLNSEWSYLLGGDAYYNMYSIAPASDGGVVFAATRYDWETQNQERDVYLVGMGPDGLMTNTEENTSHKQSVRLSPNPGRDLVKVDVNKKTFILQFYDVMGKRVLRSQNQKTIDVSHLKAGVYFYRITSNGKLIGEGKWVKE